MKLLLHVCCANCAIWPVKMLRSESVEPVGFFFNHNIHPFLEYCKRRDAVVDYARLTDLKVHWQDDYALELFLANVAANPAERCEYCYRSRLEATVRYAVQHGFSAFSTTLLYSRYQKHELIREIGERLGQQYGVVFRYADYRSGWQDGIRMSKTMGLYRQQYCGCIYSEKERYLQQRSLNGPQE